MPEQHAASSELSRGSLAAVVPPSLAEDMRRKQDYRVEKSVLESLNIDVPPSGPRIARLLRYNFFLATVRQGRAADLACTLRIKAQAR